MNLRKLLKTGMKISRVVILAGIIVTLLGNWYVKNDSSKKIVSADSLHTLPEVDCVMILGCGLKKDGTPTRMLRDRLDRGIELYQEGAAAKLLMSGDHGREEYDEVNTMKDYAIERGVPSEDIFMDHAGFSTYESMYRAKEIFKVTSTVVVTQQYHLSRAVYNGNSLGIDTYGVPALEVRYGGQKKRDLRELLARNKDLVICLFRPAPTYLGAEIPVNGDGNLTNDR